MIKIYTEQMNMLNLMGYVDKPMNVKLLTRHNGNVLKVIDELLSMRRDRNISIIHRDKKARMNLH